MTQEQLRTARRNASLSQQSAAARLRVSQPYYSQLEAGTRPLPDELAIRAVSKLGASPSILPLPELSLHALQVAPVQLASALAALGYPQFAHLRQGSKPLHPALVLAGSLAHADLEVRIIEALPWVLSECSDFATGWLVAQCRLLNLQNRLGYLVALALPADSSSIRLGNLLAELESSRLAAEATLCRDSMTQPERAWMRKHRPPLAAHWNLLTTLSREQLPYAA